MNDKLKIMAFLVCFIGSGLAVAQKSMTTVNFAIKQKNAYQAGLVPAKLELNRSANSGDLTVRYFVSGGDAVVDKDFVALSNNSVHFKDGESTANIVIQPLTDYRMKDYRNIRKDRSVEISLLPGNDYAISKISSSKVIIITDLTPIELPTDEVFFSKFNLNLDELKAVKDAVSKSNYILARKELATYFRKRMDPVIPHERKDPNQKTIQNALKNIYYMDGNVYNFGEGKWDSKNWSIPPMSIQRFDWWGDLTQAYLDDKDGGGIYAKRLFFELDDWLKSSPIDISIGNQLQPGNRWRHLDTGIRMEKSWMFAFSQLKDSPLLTDRLLIDWIKAFYQSCRFLEVNAELGTNRGFSEADGLFVAATFLPEFKEAASWQRLAVNRMENVLKSDVQNDGTLKEVSPSYHGVTVGVIQKFIEFANANKISLSPIVASATEKLLNYFVMAVEPTGNYPLMNDSYKYKATKHLEFGHALFPKRTDFLYFATSGTKGTPPVTTSHLFSDGGQAVMRSGWKSNDNYLLMDAGPFGTSHGNEDKLSINVDGYGVRHIIDCGPYNYEEDNPFRKYSVSTHGKSAPLIDDLNQNRRAAKDTHARKQNVNWYTSDKYDYASGTYGLDSLEAWGKDLVRPAITTRHVFYLKPDVWVVVDAFEALDKNPHTYSALFQCSDDNVDVDSTNKTITVQLKPGEFDPFNRITTEKIQPSLSITPLIINGLSLTMAKGQESPVISGWQFEKETTWKKQAIPTVRYDCTASGNVQMAYVLAAAPAGHAVRKPIISPIANSQNIFGLKVNVGNSKNDMFLLVALNGEEITWKGNAYKTKAMIVTTENGSEQTILLGKE